jgi:membrane protein
MSTVETAREIVEVAYDNHLPFMSASVAYYATVSIVPLLTVSLVVLSVFGATDLLMDALRSILSGAVEEVLIGALSNQRGQAAAGIVGFLVALWSAIKVFRALSHAFNELYDISSSRTFVDHLWRSLLVLGVLLGGVVLLSTVAVSLSLVDFGVPYPKLIGNVAALVVLFLVFLPFYYVLPPTPVTLRHVLPGAALSAVGWVLLQVAFFYYAGSAGGYAAYGFLGAILLFITFLYFAAIVLLAGVVLNLVVDAGPTRTRTPTRSKATKDV